MIPDYSLVGEVPKTDHDYYGKQKGLGESLLGPEFWVAVRCALREQSLWQRIPTWRTHIEGRARAADLGEMVLFLLHRLESAFNDRHLSPGHAVLLEKGHLERHTESEWKDRADGLMNARAFEALLAANLGDIANALVALAAPLPPRFPHLDDVNEAGDPIEAQETAMPLATPHGRGKRRSEGSAKAK